MLRRRVSYRTWRGIVGDAIADQGEIFSICCGVILAGAGSPGAAAQVAWRGAWKAQQKYGASHGRGWPINAGLRRDG